MVFRNFLVTHLRISFLDESADFLDSVFAAFAQLRIITAATIKAQRGSWKPVPVLHLCYKMPALEYLGIIDVSTDYFDIKALHTPRILSIPRLMLTITGVSIATATEDLLMRYLFDFSYLSPGTQKYIEVCGVPVTNSFLIDLVQVSFRDAVYY